jgi:hypothetical protein
LTGSKSRFLHTTALTFFDRMKLLELARVLSK